MAEAVVGGVDASPTMAMGFRAWSLAVAFPMKDQLLMVSNWRCNYQQRLITRTRVSNS